MANGRAVVSSDDINKLQTLSDRLSDAAAKLSKVVVELDAECKTCNIPLLSKAAGSMSEALGQNGWAKTVLSQVESINNGITATKKAVAALEV